MPRAGLGVWREREHPNNSITALSAAPPKLRVKWESRSFSIWWSCSPAASAI